MDLADEAGDAEGAAIESDDDKASPEEGIIASLRPATARERRLRALRLRQTDSGTQARKIGGPST